MTAKPKVSIPQPKVRSEPLSPARLLYAYGVKALNATVDRRKTVANG
jgi:hypothetical protein